jgi:hypothetical protein
MSLRPPATSLRNLCVTAAHQIRDEASTAEQARRGQSGYNEVSVGLRGCGLAPCDLLRRLAEAVIELSRADCPTDHSEAWNARITKRLDDLLSIAYARFYAYRFDQLPECWRRLYTDASILKFAVLVLIASGASGKQVEAAAPDVTLSEALDLAIILAGAAGEDRGRSWVDLALRLLEDVHARRPPTVSNGQGQKRTRTYRDEGEGDDVDWSATPSFSTFEAFTPPVTKPIRRRSSMQYLDFQTYLDEAPGGAPEPVILTDLTDNWAARAGGSRRKRERPWCKPAYLLSTTFGGRRLVPVELGRSYVDDGWGQSIIPFRRLLEEYIIAPSQSAADSESVESGENGRRNQPHAGEIEANVEGATHDKAVLLGTESARTFHENIGNPPAPSTTADRRKAYLAQHQLLSHIPALRDDISVPDLCYTSPPPHPLSHSQLATLEEPALNAWFGPAGTITPLHTDPHHNLLAQVVGRKYVRLYGPDAPVRARGDEGRGVDMANTSVWDVGALEGWDDVDTGSDEARAELEITESMRNEFAALPYHDCILEPGDTLYIPVGWWHYVRSLSVSFSVSFWWD